MTPLRHRETTREAMRVLFRLTRPRFRSRRGIWRRCRKYLSVTRLVLIAESLVLASAFSQAFSGNRLLFLEQLGRKGNLLVALLLLTLFAALHSLAKRYVLPRIERRFAPAVYDERGIFLDLTKGTRTVSSIDQLYRAVARRIRESLEAESVSIFVSDESSGDYLLRVSSSSQGALMPAGANEDSFEAASATRLARNAFVVRRLGGLTTPLLVEPNDFKTWEQALRLASPAVREARARESETLIRTKSRLLVQIRHGEQMVGILSLGARRKGFQYSTADRELLVSVAAQLALVIENARLTERIVAEERLLRELALAAEVQQRLLPSRPPEGVAIELAGFCEPARGVGGDYYDFITVDKQQVGLAIADVAGKGMPAALMMSTVQATLRSLTARNGSPSASSTSLAQMVGKLNRLLFNSTSGTSGENYVTFFYANFDEVTQRLTYVNAGHNPPLHLRSNGSAHFRELTSGGLIAGVFEHSNYDQETVQMESNDLLFMYTDGLTEALNRNGEEFGESRVKETLAASARLSVKQIRAEIVKRVKEWSLNVPLHDDLTFVVMKVK
jgi:phosphoserine phosphatase RsbU/P